MLMGLSIVLAVWLAILIASPVGAHKPGGGKGGTTYDVLIIGDVATVDSMGGLSSFITVGNGGGTKLGGDPVKTFLDLNEAMGISTHTSFGVGDALGVCGISVSQMLDDVEWDFRSISIGKDILVARFDRNGVYQDDCGFDDYTLRFDFELDEDDGPTVYTSNGIARLALIHYAETDDLDKPKGKKNKSHHEAKGVFTGDLTVTIIAR